MSSHTTPRRRATLGGTGFFLVVSVATIVTVALEGAFIATASWALLPFAVLVVVLAAGAVLAGSAALLNADDGEPQAEPEPEPQAAPAPVAAAPRAAVPAATLAHL